MTDSCQHYTVACSGCKGPAAAARVLAFAARTEEYIAGCTMRIAYLAAGDSAVEDARTSSLLALLVAVLATARSVPEVSEMDLDREVEAGSIVAAESVG